MDGHDFSDDADFFTQDFIRSGIVSVWLALPGFDATAKGDALQTRCGVGYYRLDDQEANASDGVPLSVERLLTPISYSESFSSRIVDVARSKGISYSSWVLVQFDFEYDPSRVTRPIDPALLYIASVPYEIDQNAHP
jgi:hypothetical protein